MIDRSELILPAALILIFGFMGIFFFEVAREYGMREGVKNWCYGEFGHLRPLSFCGITVHSGLTTDE